MDKDNIIEIENLIFEYIREENSEPVRAVGGVSLKIEEGSFTAILGKNGSGKSTLLRCLNMLETPSGGEINYHGTDITSKNVNVPEYRSKVGMVFQNFNLFPHFSVLKNITDAPIHV